MSGGGTTGRRVPRVLSIAGTDPSGGAGIQADLKSIAAVGGYGMSAVTALVAQNTRGVRSVHVPPAAFLAEQLDAVSDDVVIDAVKIGMLANAEIIRTVGDWLRRVKPPVVVLDPVMIATSGDRLLDADAEAALRELLPLAHLITPNLHEQAVLAGEPRAATWTEALAQAERLSASLGVLVLAKGGHLGGTAAPDALVDASGRVGPSSVRSGSGATGTAAPRIIEFPGERIETANTHGTGCSLSSAIATLRAELGSWEAAVIEARRWLRESITHGASLDVGEGHGPISHFAGLWERGGLSTAPAPNEVEAEWWAGIADVRDAIDELGFVRGLADGSLDRSPFLRYLAQDALYLRDYSRVLAVASSSATDAAEQAFWAASARGAIIGELELHASWLPEGEAFAAEPDAATTGYLNHLLATAARGDYPVLAAALLPCFWIYVDLGGRLAAGAFGPQALAPEHPYASWLKTYADPGFSVGTREAIGIVMRLAAAADAPTREAMWRAFRASSEHELAFFASPLGEQGAGTLATTTATAHTANPQLRSDIRGTAHEPAVFS